MFNLKNTLIGSLALVSTLLGGLEAKAEVGSYQSRVNLLESIHRVADSTQKHCDRSTYGFYTPSDVSLTVCTNHTGGDMTPLYWETVRHEAVHLAQDCINPREWVTIMDRDWLLENSSYKTREFVRKNYEPEDYWIEVEANTLEKYSNEVITDLVNEACASGSPR